MVTLASKAAIVKFLQKLIQLETINMTHVNCCNNNALHVITI